jgi:hypothetical protein
MKKNTPKWIFVKNVRDMAQIKGTTTEKSDEEIEELEKTVNRSIPPKEIREMSKKEYEDWQEAEELKRKKYLEGEGKKGDEYITKKALEKWLGEGRTYSEIARDYVGVSRIIVGIRAREYGLQSEMSKKIKEIRAKEKEEEKKEETQEKIKKISERKVTKISEYE